MTPDGNKNGFGIEFIGSYANACWWKNNNFHGNHMQINLEDLSIAG